MNPTLTLPHRLIDEDGNLICADCQGDFSEAGGVLLPGDETGECGERWKAECVALRALFAPAEGVDVEEVLRLDQQRTSGRLTFAEWEDCTGKLADASPALAREVARLREDRDGWKTLAERRKEWLTISEAERIPAVNDRARLMEEVRELRANLQHHLARAAARAPILTAAAQIMGVQTIDPADEEEGTEFATKLHGVVDDLRNECNYLLSPVEDVDIKWAGNTFTLLCATGMLPRGMAGDLLFVVPKLVREVARLRADLATRNDDLTRIADLAGHVLDGQPHTEEDRAWWAACHARVTNESQGTPLEIVAAVLHELAEARADLEEQRLTLAAEQGRAEGAPSQRWRSFGRTTFEVLENGARAAFVWRFPESDGWGWWTSGGCAGDALTARAAMTAADEAAR